MKVLELEEKMTNIAVAIARIEASLASMERELLLLQQTHSAEIAKELARLDRDIAQGKLEIEAAGGEAKRPPKPPDANIVVRYRIKRLQAQTLAAIDAGEGTLLRPGDVLDVRIGSSIQQATN